MSLFNNSSLLLCLVLLATSSRFEHGAEAARPISPPQSQNDTHQKNFMRLFGTLGVVCKCCDGPNGSCTSNWSSGCSDLRCVPWKQA